jgi:hypothetical protein
MVLIGGLVPETLVSVDDPHQGTVDVDVLLPVALVFDREDQDFGWLEGALTAAGFVLVSPNTGWRWMTSVDGAAIVVEFLADVPDSPGQELALPGARTLSANNLAGPAPALRDTREIAVGRHRARAAGVGGYLAAKAAAIVGRGLVKDLYDFAYVIVHSLAKEGPMLAQHVESVVVQRPEVGRDMRREVLHACGRFETIDAVGPRAYAAEALRAGSTKSYAELAEEATESVTALAQLMTGGEE